MKNMLTAVILWIAITPVAASMSRLLDNELTTEHSNVVLCAIQCAPSDDDCLGVITNIRECLSDRMTSVSPTHLYNSALGVLYVFHQL